ncbi:microtubule-associated proteins 1A/1B light chain 3C-like [Panonychus citri]|uniref:microtubule-associated proteins 1A/1B light chain 3C-like n=1 Tax=Panonychus citri TaxID=50023 RepID=UPI002307A839|nr:microtubule-associated proteins 1A/1B light chain 3C-like [Panonychus citri]
MPLKLSRIINNQRDKKQPFPCPPSYKRFKERKSLSVRKAEYATLKAKFPNKVMVVVERYAKERYLPLIDKTKFLVPEDLCASKLMMIIRSRMDLSNTQAVYLMTANRTMINMTKTLAEIHDQFKDEDGFVYITYASQNVFG